VATSMTSALMPSPASLSGASRAAVAQHEAHVQRQGFAVVDDHFLVLAVDALGLHVDHRVGIAHGGQQQAVGTLRAGRQHHAQARHVGEDRFVGFAVVFRRADATAPRHAQHHRAVQAATGTGT